MMTNLPMNKNMIKQWLHVLWLLPGLWLVGCSTDKGAEAVDTMAPRPVVFTISTEETPEETRGYPLNELDAEFGLFCAKYDDEWGDLGQPLNFMYNEMVMGSGDTWSTSEGYFVPAKTYNLKFFAYYPYYDNVKDGSCPLVMYGDELSAYPAPSFIYTMPQDADEQLDLMYAISDQVHANDEGKLSTVHLHFRHLLTAMTIAAKTTEECTIKRITLKNLYKKGEFEFRDGAVLRADQGEGVEDVTAYLDMKLRPNTLGTYKQADDGKSFMLILQPLDGQSQIVLHQNASMEVVVEASGKEYTFSKSLADLATSLTTCKNTLLRLSIEKLQRIKVTATITDWGHGANFNGAVSDQATLELEPLVVDWVNGSNIDITTAAPSLNP